MRNRFIDTLIAAGEGRDDLIFLSGDAGLGVFDGLRRDAPGSFVNMGVAEQNMAGFAAGLAMTGHKVVMYNIIPFLLYRCYEQVRNDICYQGLPVIMAGIGSGITYAPQGMSHYSIEDLGIAATMPNLAVISPCDATEARAAAEYALSADQPVYVRLAKRGEQAIHTSAVTDISTPLKICSGSDCALLFHGSIAEEVMAAAALLEEDGISVMLISVPMVQPLNEDALVDMLGPVRLVVTVEEHYEHSGLGSSLLWVKSEADPGWRLKTAGIPRQFIHEVYDCKGLRRLFGLDAVQLARKVKGWLADE
ncbi:hypothetical protein OR1_02845 [Geobacter sp. OR-1]|uniref:transketolase family protein n=1 Tax=Geobacter sp. OR-1 TaxID=1266765 RepID=UPI00054223A5|nr:transketolase C-terminal domain-containing protein [Geobacter sp. OR-1]GAM10556.1 hypothetical protein OR1_02845 [Geobacter sp. OR-1]